MCSLRKHYWHNITSIEHFKWLPKNRTNRMKTESEFEPRFSQKLVFVQAFIYQSEKFLFSV